MHCDVLILIELSSGEGLGLKVENERWWVVQKMEGSAGWGQ
jgi:hypothetical protein